jgi:hypothetical protein
VVAAARQRRAEESDDGADEVTGERARANLDACIDVAELFDDGIIHASTIAKIFTSVGRGRWSTRRAKRFLKRSGIGFQMGGPTDEWATTTLELKAHYPALWRLIEAKLADLL